MLATPRGITQPHTSFIGSACQGIHRAPVTKHTNTKTPHTTHQQPNSHQHIMRSANKQFKKHTFKRIKMLASTIQFSHNTPPPTTTHPNSAQQPVTWPKGTNNMLFQTPNSMPTHKKFSYRNCYRQPPVRHHTTHNKCTSTRIQHVAATPTVTQPHTHNCGQQKTP